MAGRIDARLAELGITLPPANPPVANYVPYVRAGSLVYLSGQISQIKDGPAYIGQIGRAVTVEDGMAAARICGLNLLAWLQQACDGDLDRVERCVRLGGFVNAAAGFRDHPKVVNGCSDLMVEVFGDKGRHARSAVGSSSLPFDVAVEIEAIFSLEAGH